MNRKHNDTKKRMLEQHTESRRIPVSGFRFQVSQQASSLITTLLVLVVLSTVVVAFMQSMSVERNVAKNVKNKLQAELAASAGVADGLARLNQLMIQNPYHAIGYTNVGGQTLTILTGLASYTNTGAPTTNYLLSVTNPAIAPSGLNSTNSMALNLATTGGSGWIGSAVTNGAFTNRECRAPWVYILKTPAQPHQPDPAVANYNPYVARYAYWIEDETSKIDFRVAGNNNASGGFQRSTNTNSPADIDLGAAPILGSAPIPTNNTSANNSLITFRNSTTNLPADGRQLGQATGVLTNAAESSRYYVTVGSYANDLAGTGQKRVNLNAIVTQGFATNTISSDLDDIAYVITGTHIYPGLNNASDQGLFHDLPATNGPMPDFGSRFYSGVTAANKVIYLKKIAANIRDYIDSDSQPTLVDGTGAVTSSPAPSGWWNLWPPQAIGKEGIPYLQETAWTGVETSWSGSGSTRTGSLEIDQYFELFNPNTKDFTFPSGSKIQISNMPTWSAGSYPAIEPADFEIDISGINVPAGKTVVITTNPGPTSNDPGGMILDSSNLQRRQPATQEGTRKFTTRQTSEVISGTVGFQLSARSSSISDTQSRFIITTPNGTIDALPEYGFSAQSATPWNFKGQNGGDRKRFVYAASLAGNRNASGQYFDGRTGDPRSLSEQLQLQGFNSGNQDNTRFYGTIQGGGPPGSATFGNATTTFVDPTRNLGTTGAWGDWNQAPNNSSATAYAVVRDGPMLSIGELGNVYDPYRLASPAGINASRGGGRTLKVGQNDDLIAGQARFSTNWQNAAWRLTDIFGVSTNLSKTVLDPTSRGKININSVARDGGTVLTGLLRSFTFLPSPDGDSGIAGKPVSPTDMQALITSIQTYLTAKGPMMERGELSEVDYFAGTNSTNTVAGKTFTTLNDRGREELFRRLIELITTRSSSFSIYSVGQALQESSNGTIRSVGQAREGHVYRFDPVIGPKPRDPVTGYNTQQLYDIP